jgi:hypothetical protein
MSVQYAAKMLFPWPFIPLDSNDLRLAAEQRESVDVVHVELHR